MLSIVQKQCECFGAHNRLPNCNGTTPARMSTEMPTPCPLLLCSLQSERGLSTGTCVALLYAWSSKLVDPWLPCIYRLRTSMSKFRLQGFSAAQDDILKHLDERVREQAEKEYARHVAEEETQRVAQVEKEAAALERKYAR